MPTAQDNPRRSAREILAANMKALRAERRLSQEDLALECELHRTFIAHVERGVRNISIDNVEKIAGALGVPTYRLLIPTDATSEEASRG